MTRACGFGGAAVPVALGAHAVLRDRPGASPGVGNDTRPGVWPKRRVCRGAV